MFLQSQTSFLYMAFTILNSKYYIKLINSTLVQKFLLEYVTKVKLQVLRILLKKRALCSSSLMIAKFGTLEANINLSCQIELSIEEFS